MTLVTCLKISGAVAAAVYGASIIYHRLIHKAGEPLLQAMNDGNSVYVISGDLGAPFVYREIYESEVYLRNGITLEGIERPLVIDAGANIGLFARYIALKFPSAQVVGSEPIGDVANVARMNTQFANDRVSIAVVALGKSRGQAVFEYSPNLSCGSATKEHLTEATKLASASGGTIEWVRAIFVDSANCGLFPRWLPVGPVCNLLSIPYLRIPIFVGLLPSLLLFFIWLHGEHLPSKDLLCDVITVDELLATQGITDDRVIDLLKVDVEGSELDILEGISDSLWRRIRQLIVETQDIEGRQGKIERLLLSKGFEQVVSVDEEFEVHKLLHVTSIFARKKVCQ